MNASLKLKPTSAAEACDCLLGCGMADSATTAELWKATATRKAEQWRGIMEHILEQRCPDDRVGFEASRGNRDPCVFSLKNGPSILIPESEIASRPFKKRRRSRGIRWSVRQLLDSNLVAGGLHATPDDDRSIDELAFGGRFLDEPFTRMLHQLYGKRWALRSVN